MRYIDLASKRRRKMQSESSYSREGYLHENFRYFHLRDNAGQERDYHFHEFDKIVVLISGSVTYMVEGTACEMQPGDVVLVRHHAIHKAEIDRTVQYDRVIIYLDTHYIDISAPGSGLLSCFDKADRERKYLLRPEGGDSEKIKGLLMELEASLNDAEFGAEVLRNAEIMRLLVQLDRMAMRGQAVEGSDAADPKIGAVLSYINENLSGELTVEALAERAYMSKYHFMRLFKSQTGFTVHGYIRQKRLLRAAQLIRGGIPATKAAAECGFRDYSAFHRAFRETFNISPSSLSK
jgi:AraC-like DNA-binding protein